MKREIYYVKSLEKDFATKTLVNKKKVIYQTVEDIIKTKILKPNTLSFGRKRRLACTLINKNYLKTYRSQGIIFQTKDKPNQILPFDIVLLSNADKIIVQYYRIENNLHEYYNHTLIPGFKKFIFSNFNEMNKKIPSPKISWEKVNKFREKNGYSRLEKSKHKLVEYNEAIFYKKIRIKPVALFGYIKETKRMAKKLGLPYFTSVKQFYKKVLIKQI